MVVSWDTSDSRHAFIVTPETLHRAVCADLPFDECNISARVFADVATDEARTTLLGNGFSEVAAPADVDRLDQVGPVPWYLAAFLCVLAVAGVLHALLTALRRRRRDIAITRALGLTGGRAADSLVWQAVLTALVGVATGTLLGVIVGPMRGGSSPPTSASSSARSCRRRRGAGGRDRVDDRRAALVGATLAGCPSPADRHTAVRASVMGALGLWARAEIRNGWRSLVVLALMITLVVGTVAALVAGARRSASAVDRFDSATELAELRVFAGQEPSTELLARLQDDDRIVAVERGDVVLVAPGVMAGPYAQMVIGASDDSLGGFGRPLIVAGRYPTPGAPDEIVVNERGAATLGIAVDDRVPMLARPCFDATCEQIPIGDATIVGVVRLGVDLQPTRQRIWSRSPGRRSPKVAGARVRGQASFSRFASPRESTRRHSPASSPPWSVARATSAAISTTWRPQSGRPRCRPTCCRSPPRSRRWSGPLSLRKPRPATCIDARATPRR